MMPHRHLELDRARFRSAEVSLTGRLVGGRQRGDQPETTADTGLSRVRTEMAAGLLCRN